MKKRLLTVLLVVAAAGFALGGGQASASPESSQSPAGLTSPALLTLIANDDLFATTDLSLLLDPAGTHATQHYGPYASGSTDSGTCGINDWATDTFDRHFTVRHNPDGTFTVVEQFKNGSFETIAGASPGSCDTNDGSPPGTVSAGVKGGMHGYFIIPLPALTTQTSYDSSCIAGNPTAPCTTGGFIDSHFTPCYDATCSATTFFFHYVAVDQGLVENEWKNASADRGGNHGDIRSLNAP
jgi:hypothetical protein